MPIEDIFTIQGRGTVVTGRIERGEIKVNEEIEIVGIRETQKTVCTGVEMFRKLLDEGKAGENVVFFLEVLKETLLKEDKSYKAWSNYSTHKVRSNRLRFIKRRRWKTYTIL